MSDINRLILEDFFDKPVGYYGGRALQGIGRGLQAGGLGLAAVGGLPIVTGAPLVDPTTGLMAAGGVAGGIGANLLGDKLYNKGTAMVNQYTPPTPLPPVTNALSQVAAPIENAATKYITNPINQHVVQPIGNAFNKYIGDPLADRFIRPGIRGQVDRVVNNVKDLTKGFPSIKP